MRESPAEASEGSQNDSKPQTPDTSQNSNSETDSKTFVEVDSIPIFRKGFRRKKGESPYVCDMNVNVKRKKDLNLKHIYIQTHHHHLILQKLGIYLTQV